MQQAAHVEQTKGGAGGARVKKRTRFRFGKPDLFLLLNLLALLVFGLLMLFSASYPKGLLVIGNRYYYIFRQLTYVGLGMVAMFGIMMIDYRIMKKFAWPLMVLALALLVAVLFMAEKNHVKRWFWIGDPNNEQGFQPSEIAKFAIILLFAFLISQHQHRIKTFKYGFLPFVVVLGSVAALLILEPHLSCTVLVLGIGITMMFAGGTSMKWFAVAGVAMVGIVILLLPVIMKEIPYAANRIDTWLNPLEHRDQDDGWQTVQSLIAIGSGGPTGRGIGQSRQKFLYLPEMFNDYIYAIVCEELGLVGGIIVIVLFLSLLLRCLYIALRVKDKFGQMLVIGIAVQIALQAFLHIAVNTNAIPSTGISLPFFSYGGTALCMLLAQMGVVLSVSRRADLDNREKAEPPVLDSRPDIPAGQDLRARRMV